LNNRQIVLKKVKVNNLKSVDLILDQNELIVFTGVSGSGKSSLAFDTIYIEGQRRYIESLSHSVKRFLTELKKPDAQEISGLSPTIAIEQKTISKNPRSTAGTLTGIYDFLRVLFARAGTPHCPISGEVVKPRSRDEIISSLKNYKKGAKIIVLSPFSRGKKGSFKVEFSELLKKGFTKVRVDGTILDLEEIKELDPDISHEVDIIIDRITISDDFSRLKEAIYQALETGKGFFSILDQISQEIEHFSEYAYSPKSNRSYLPLEPSDFSFNHPSGMCEKCSGLGEVFEFDLDKIINPDLSIAEDCCCIAGHNESIKYGNIYRNLAEIYDFDINTPWKKLSSKAKEIFLYGTEKKWTPMYFTRPGKKRSYRLFVQWRGVIAEGHKKIIDAKSDLYREKMESLMTHMICPICLGSRLKSYPNACEFEGKKINEITNMTIAEALDFFQKKRIKNQVASDLIFEITQRLHFLKEVGLHYLSLARTAPTLSGGEGQRVRLAAQLGSGLIGTTYILDEPSIGLHPQDHRMLINTLFLLRDKGNTVIVVEHDRETICAADTIVDVGPLAGKFGGEILAKGSLKDIIKSKKSITGKYLSGELKIKVREKRKPSQEKLKIFGVSHHNLKHIDVTIPLRLFVCITGVSGSGKSSLISQTLYPAIFNLLHHQNHPCGKYKKIEGLEHLGKIVFVDQSPIGKTIRSNPATYIKVLDDIRDLFASLPESKIRGFLPGHFSFNVKEGSCPYCKGLGQVKLDLDFMEDVWTICHQCKGKRFSLDILAVTYKGYNIYDILEMEVANALTIFEFVPAIYSKLKLLQEVGLDYLRLGQSSTTLSGGEAQRIKLAKELSKKGFGKTLYILDEPTTGLHFHDIDKLINVLHNLVDQKNSVIVIEHNMDFVKASDYIIDIGPLAGEEGGEVVAEGPPEVIIDQKTPTGLALKSSLKEKLSPSSKKSASSQKRASHLIIKNGHLHNLKNIDLNLPLGKINIFTGPSGSGKTTLAFDTIYAEGQRRYIEAMPLYTRQFLKLLPKAKVDKIENLSPCIALQQKSHRENPRSTVGTITEIYDHLRLLFAHMGTPYCPETKEEIKTITCEYVVQKVLSNFKGEKVQILCPINFLKIDDISQLKDYLIRQGYLRIRLNQKYYELDEEIPYNKSLKNEILLVIDRLKIALDVEKRLFEAISSATKLSGGEVILGTESKDIYFNLSFTVESTGKSYPPITPQTFSFNSEEGMCLECLGLGQTFGFTLANFEGAIDLSISEIMEHLLHNYYHKEVKELLTSFFKNLKIDIDKPLSSLSKEAQDIFLNGADHLSQVKKGLIFQFRGINKTLATLAKHANYQISEPLSLLVHTKNCLACGGTRLNPLARNVKIENRSISDICSLDISEASKFIDSISSDKGFIEEIISHIKTRLSFMNDLGLSYLSLDRSSPTLSGGEIQRIYLAKHLGSGLTNCLYILDEPTIGLHPYDSSLLIEALKKLNELNNTLLIVEHDPEIISHADYICDFGPKAGQEGGEIIAQGNFEEIKANPKSLTGLYLSNKKSIPIPAMRKKVEEFIHIKNSTLHNLKNISVDIPKKVITSITGVSGSGKSTLINYILKPAVENNLKAKLDEIDLGFAKISNISSFDRVISITQKLIGTTTRSDVSTYSEIMPLIRLFFSQLPQSVAKGFKPRYFSFNHPRGMCKTCYGHGIKKIDLQFLPAVEVVCPTCQGYKLNSRSLEITYKNKNIGQILEMTISEAIEFFEAFPKILRKLTTLQSVGLEYLKLGQEISTLSGGEGQRLKLASELSKKSSGNTLYLLDEPTVGLHNYDIEKLLKIFHRLKEKNNTIIIIEHNIEVIANSDYVIDLGPYSGKYGGEIICFGTPEEISKNKNSHTAKYLLKKLSPIK
jgi:excinuclease ABC subunit A